jgi:hypothetical protein
MFKHGYVHLCMYSYEHKRLLCLSMQVVRKKRQHLGYGYGISLPCIQTRRPKYDMGKGRCNMMFVTARVFEMKYIFW